MPPNRKQNFDVLAATLSVDDIAVPNNNVIKFPPLTSTKADTSVTIAPAAEAKKQEASAQDETNLSYWDWPSDDVVEEKVESSNEVKVDKEAMIQQILEEDRIRLLLSVEQVQQNIVDSPQKEESAQISRNNEEAVAGYWDDEVPEEEKKNEKPVIVAKHSLDTSHPMQSYWDWDASIKTKDEQTKQAVERIMLQEKNRQLLSVQQLEENLVKNTPTEESELKPENDSYWNWDNAKEDESHSYWDWPTLTPEEKKMEIIQNIIKEEKIRQSLSIDAIQENLTKSCRVEESPQQAPSLNESAACFGDAAYFAGEPSYWDW